MKRLLLILLILLSLVIMAYAANLFSDGFESGNLTAWGGSAIDGGDLSAHADAKLHGNYGLKAVIDDATNIYVNKVVGSQTRFRCRFYLDPNSVAMDNGEVFYLLYPYNSAYSINPFVVGLVKSEGVYKIYVGDYTGAAYWYATISDAPHCIEVDWKAGVANGELHFWLDGNLIGESTDVPANYNIYDIYLGAVIFTGTISGTIYLDDFVSNNDGTAIGVITEAPAGNAIMFGINF